MYAKRFSNSHIKAKFNWFNFRRKLENANNPKLRVKSHYNYYKRVIPQMKQIRNKLYAPYYGRPKRFTPSNVKPYSRTYKPRYSKTSVRSKFKRRRIV